MRIAFFYELNFGGARNAANEIAKRFKESHIVDLYYVDKKKDSYLDKFYSRTYPFLFEENMYEGKNFFAKIKSDYYDKLKLFYLHKKIAGEINKKKYDIFFVNPSRYTQSPLLLRFVHTKKIYYCQEAPRFIYDDSLQGNRMGFLKGIYSEIYKHIYKFLDKINIGFADFIFVNSNFSKKNIDKIYKINSSVNYLGVDHNFYKPLKIKKDIDVLYIGTKSFVDGYDVFCRLVETNKKIKFKFIDSFTNNISDKELLSIYNKSMITLCLSRNEPFGLIPLESMSCGVPVVALNQGGYKESVAHNSTGYLVDDDIGSISMALNKLLNNKKLYENFSLASRKHVIVSWTWDKNAVKIQRNIEEIYEKY